jgi:hypothetical protein
VINRFGVDHCTYIDADMYFYTDPVRSSKRWERTRCSSHPTTTRPNTRTFAATSGVYCVQFVTFRNDDQGLEVLNWWADAASSGARPLRRRKFGDQKYLDDTPSGRARHCNTGWRRGWNAEQYVFRTETASPPPAHRDGRDYPVVFFHFHG